MTTRGTVQAVSAESSYVGIGWNLWGFLPHFLPQPVASDTGHSPGGKNARRDTPN
jgi:hypothetical protein